MAYKFFPGTPFGAYQGNIASRPFSRNNQNGYVIVASVNFASPGYAVGGEPLGDANPNFAVLVDYQAGANVPQPFIIQSVYVDNSDSITPIFIFFADTLYTVQVEAGAQGWFPVISNSPQAYVIALGLETGFLPLVNVYFSNLFLPPYTAVASPNVIPLKLASPVIGGGSSLSGIAVTASGNWYSGTGLTINGGGGTGASAHGVLDAYGEFTSVILDDPGEEFTGFPTVTATASQSPPAAWNGNNGSYSTGALVSYGGTAWSRTSSNIPPGANGAYPGDPLAPQIWSNTGISTTLQTATFQAQLGSAGNAIITDGYGPAALGDQSFNLISPVTGTGVFEANLFGSPFNQGFIYVTNIDVRLLSAGILNWRFQSSDGDVIPYPFETFAGMASGTQLLNLNGQNLKLDATKTWELNCTAFMSDATLSHALTYTYALV